MKLSPGDQIQIILTVGGVPYAKTWVLKHEYHQEEMYPVATLASKMTLELCRDIHFFGDEPVG